MEPKVNPFTGDLQPGDELQQMISVSTGAPINRNLLYDKSEIDAKVAQLKHLITTISGGGGGGGGGLPVIDGAAGTNRDLTFQTSGVDRWKIRVDTTAEDGEGVNPQGSNLLVQRYDDAGNFLSTVMSLRRAGGDMTLGDGVGGVELFSGYTIIDGGPIELDNDTNIYANLFTSGHVAPGNGNQSGGKLWSGSGAPDIAASIAGDFYFRTDTPTTANQRIYIATAANTWTGIV